MWCLGRQKTLLALFFLLFLSVVFSLLLILFVPNNIISLGWFKFDVVQYSIQLNVVQYGVLVYKRRVPHAILSQYRRRAEPWAVQRPPIVVIQPVSHHFHLHKLISYEKE